MSDKHAVNIQLSADEYQAVLKHNRIKNRDRKKSRANLVEEIISLSDNAKKDILFTEKSTGSYQKIHELCELYFYAKED